MSCPLIGTDNNAVLEAVKPIEVSLVGISIVLCLLDESKENMFYNRRAFKYI